MGSQSGSSPSWELEEGHAGRRLGKRNSANLVFFIPFRISAQGIAPPRDTQRLFLWGILVLSG